MQTESKTVRCDIFTNYLECEVLSWSFFNFFKTLPVLPLFLMKKETVYFLVLCAPCLCNIPVAVHVMKYLQTIPVLYIFK